MTADDLRALSAEATPGPWDGNRHLIFEPIEDTPDGQTGALVADVDHPEDLELIVWLRNHADALADLIDATRAFTEYEDEAAIEDHQRMCDALAALDGDR